MSAPINPAIVISTGAHSNLVISLCHKLGAAR